MTLDTHSYNVGTSDYSDHIIQPWHIWYEYKLNPWDADIIKHVLRTKDGESRKLEYQKIKHVCDERIRQLDLEVKDLRICTCNARSGVYHAGIYMCKNCKNPIELGD